MNEDIDRYIVRITREAELDLDDIFDFIFVESADLEIATNFTTKLLATTLESLSYLPQRNPIYQENIRLFVYPDNTDYNIYYQIDTHSKSVSVLAITNSNQFTRYNDL